ncbi:MAG: DNA recombination protein RmuC [Alphaproteobacteria bacterium]|nr:DNA recombination protein RmuC [Alphaproteobacteria bacterium]
MSAELVIIASIGLAAIILAAVVVAAVRMAVARAAIPPRMEVRLLALEAGIGRGEAAVREEAGRGREEGREAARSLREEVAGCVAGLAGGVHRDLTDLAAIQSRRLDGFAATLNEAKAEAAARAEGLRGELGASLQHLLDTHSRTVALMLQQAADRQEALRHTVEGRLDAIRHENAAKLEQMRLTVDEKLQATLEQRLGASFRQVNDSLEQVYRSVGEMQALAAGVGDLKRVLTNIKSRGTWGEVSLGNLLEEALAPDQYDRNIEIQPGSNQRVEFAIRLPGDGQTPVWLPLDAKFPLEDYERLVDAVERGEVAAAEIAARAVEARIRGAGRDICAKYVHPPRSTDFAVLFVPTEGLFAEIVRRPGLVDALQRECHVMVAGPTTLLSLLTALRMGFRSLAIQKRSDEVWKVLGAVKHEFGQFGTVIDGLGRKLDEAQKFLDERVGRRRRAMERQLRAVESLPEDEATALLGLAAAGLPPEDELREAAE